MLSPGAMSGPGHSEGTWLHCGLVVCGEETDPRYDVGPISVHPGKQVGGERLSPDLSAPKQALPFPV